MEGFDEGNVFFSYQNREGAESAATNATGRTAGGSLNAVETRRRFKAFLLGFNNQRYRYVYADRLRSAVRAGVLSLEVELTDLSNFDAPLAAHLRDRPAHAMPDIERAATEAAAVLQNTTSEELVQASAGRANGTVGEGDGTGDNDAAQRTGDDALPDAGSSNVGRIFVQVLLRTGESGRPVRGLASSDVSKLVCIEGIVIAASKVQCKSTAVRLRCRNCSDRITVHVGAGLSGFAAPRTCRRVLGEGEEACPLDPYIVLPDEGRYVDNQVLKLQELPESVPTGEMPRSITLSCERYLTDLVSPGVRVSVIGVYSVSTANAPGVGGSRKRAPRSGSSLSVAARAPYLRVLGLSVQESASYSGSRSFHAFSFEEDEEMMKIARTPKLYDIISRSIAPEIFGHADIKKAIAAQLFGGAMDKVLPDGMRLRGDINVLLLGDPSTAKSQMLKFAERVAPISVYTSGKGSSAAGLTASVIKDKMHGEFHLEGGAMVLADGGMVCIDEFDKMRLQDRVAIHEAMEQQTISIAKAGITAVLNARSAVLAAANPAFGRYDDTRSSADNIEFQSTILSRFDLIFIVRDRRDDVRDRTIAEHVLSLHQRGSATNTRRNRAATHGSAIRDEVDGGVDDSASASRLGVTGTGDDACLDINSLKRFIGFARHRASPRLSEEAAELLRNNYVSIREQMRSKQLGDDEGGSGTVPITVRQLEAIVRISESLAKMTLDSVVRESHVTEAIRLFKVATLDSANAGAIQSAEGALRPDVRAEVQRVESALKRRLAIGSTASERRLIDHFLDEKYSEFSVRNAIMVMVRRGDLQYRKQRKYLHRVQ